MLAQAASTATASPPLAHYRVQLESCVEQAVTDPEFRECYGAAISAADERLNERWKRLMQLVDELYPDARAPLVAEERAWIAFKEGSCTAFYSQGFGSMHRVIAAPDCRLDIIEHRIADIEGYISWLDIDEYENAGDAPQDGK
ncbi:lysozyme inhibitor LprI family protein [Qipengyuania qiaonensis]|nr:lysozyme inhibitor LprI family protein [Qipengyuania qiaonensis]